MNNGDFHMASLASRLYGNCLSLSLPLPSPSPSRARPITHSFVSQQLMTAVAMYRPVHGLHKDTVQYTYIVYYHMRITDILIQKLIHGLGVAQLQVGLLLRHSLDRIRKQIVSFSCTPSLHVQIMYAKKTWLKIKKKKVLWQGCSEVCQNNPILIFCR